MADPLTRVEREHCLAPEQKTCAMCPRPIIRPASIGEGNWRNRRFCSAACSRLFHNQKIDRASDAPVFQPPEVAASHELLRRLLRYGLRHDGLQGLPAVALMALAQSHGVSA